jgi:hypothetical protein
MSPSSWRWQSVNKRLDLQEPFTATSDSRADGEGHLGLSA